MHAPRVLHLLGALYASPGADALAGPAMAVFILIIGGGSLLLCGLSFIALFFVRTRRGAVIAGIPPVLTLVAWLVMLVGAQPSPSLLLMIHPIISVALLFAAASKANQYSKYSFEADEESSS